MCQTTLRKKKSLEYLAFICYWEEGRGALEYLWRSVSLYPEHVHSCGTARSGWLLAVAGPYVWLMVDLGFSIHCTCMCQ